MLLFIFSFLIVLASGQDTIDPVPMPTLDPSPMVTIRQGTVVGSNSTDGTYVQFYGIPYADSTSGSHRFKAPYPPPSFLEPYFFANRTDIKCVRFLRYGGYDGTEDCLVVNVFTPNLDSTANLPVIVWIRGKEFTRTSVPELHLEHFVRKDVVVVTLNFRESILGFLCLGTETAPGNAGLKDIIAGLQWVQENIAQFGGDPNNVSLLGHGSGAAAVDLITLSPISSGLVHKAISQSGTAFAPWAVARDNIETALQIASALGHTTTSLEDLSEVFARTSLSALMAVISDLELTDNSLAFAPCIEREGINGVEPFLLKSPYKILEDRDFEMIPFMTGYVDIEGTIRSEEAIVHGWQERMVSAFPDFLQPDLKFENIEERDKLSEIIKAFYSNFHSIEDYLRYHGDTMIKVPAIRETQMRASVSSAPVYLYQFSYKSSLGHTFINDLIEVEETAHGEELAYLYYNSGTENISSIDLTMSDIMVERWTNFAKHGEPTSDISQEIWRPYTSENQYFLCFLDNHEIIEGTLEVLLEDPDSETINFWNQIYEQHFFDAGNNWSSLDRNDTDEELIPESEEEENGEDNETDNGEPGNGAEDGSNEDEIDVDGVETDAASSVVGYTFIIIALFSMLSHMHCSLILS